MRTPLFTLSLPACCASSSCLRFFLPSAGRFHSASRSPFDLFRLMLSISSPIPSICITPAPPEKNHPEPYSPIPSAMLGVEDDHDGYRSNWLSLPPLAGSFPWHSSPLRPVDCPPRKGLSQDQFHLLLKVSRDQRARLGSQKIPDLRKELALRNQSLKQLERRTRFLSNVNEPLCTATTSIPGVSPIAHRSISPRGFKSECSALEVAAENSEDLVVVKSPTNPEWDEQVERGLLIAEQPLASPKFSSDMPKKSRPTPPSLNEITARLQPVHVSFKNDCSRSRLPDFLKALRLSPGSADTQIKTAPVRSLAINDEKFDTTFAQQVIRPQHPDPCTLRAVTPRAVDLVAGPALPTSRADTARDMIATLKRRSSPPPALGPHECTWTSTKVKRCSAPAELQHSGRVGFDRVAVARGGF